MTLFTFTAEYLEQLAKGDELVAQHFGSYFSSLLRLKLRARLRSPELIEDITQETLLRVLNIARNREVRHPERLGGLVSAVCTNVIRESVRNESRYDPMEDDTPEPHDHSIDLDAGLATGQTRRKIEETLKSLEPRDREILRAVMMEEADRTAVCEKFSINEEYLRVLLHRAKAKFRQNFDGERQTKESRSASSGKS